MEIEAIVSFTPKRSHPSLYAFRASAVIHASNDVELSEIILDISRDYPDIKIESLETK